MGRNLWAGLDVGAETTSVCVIDDQGEVLQEATCRTDLRSVHQHIRWLRRRRFARVGLEAGGYTLARGLRSLGYSVDMYEVRQLSKFLRVRRNKTDAGDAIGIAEAGRIGASLVPKVHLKSLECQSLQSRLTIRRHMIKQRVAALNLLCRQVELYGGRISRVSRATGFTEFRVTAETEFKRLFGRDPNPLAGELRQLLQFCEQLIEHQHFIDGELKALALGNELCRRFMEIPGIGPIASLTFYATIGEPRRFKRARDVGPYLGLTPKIHQSGLTLRSGRISKMGNVAARTALVQAAMVITRSTAGDSELRSWALQLEKRCGRPKARVALARKLAVMMIAMWKNGEPYRPRPAMPTG